MATVTLQTLKDWINVRDTVNDTALTALITRAEAYLEAETGRRIGAAETYTEIRSGGTDTIYLADEPATITSVETRSGTDWSFESVAEFDLSGRRLTRMDGGIFPEGPNTRVIYSRGFSTTPGTVEQAVLELCEHWWRNRTRVTDI